jgi:hypothetical protein
MAFELDKCTKTVFKKGKLVSPENSVTDINKERQEFEQGKT